MELNGEPNITEPKTETMEKEDKTNDPGDYIADQVSSNASLCS